MEAPMWKTHRLRTQKRSLIMSTVKGSSKVRIDNHRSAVLSCEYHKSGQVFISSNSHGQIHICATNSGTEKLSFLKGHKEEVTEVHYSNDGLDVFSSSMDRTISIWDAFRGIRKSVIFGHNSGVTTVQCLDAEWPVICSGSLDKSVRVWDVRQRGCSAMFKCDQEIATTSFSGCGRYVFSGGLSSGAITAWDTRRNNEVVQVLRGHTNAITGLSLSPNGRYLASCSLDGTLRTWDVCWLTQVNEVLNFPVEQGNLNHLRRCAWSPDGRLLTAGTTASNVSVFNINSGAKVFELDGHTDAVIDLAFHPRKKVLMSGGADRKMFMHYM